MSVCERMLFVGCEMAHACARRRRGGAGMVSSAREREPVWVASAAAQVVDSFTGHALLHFPSCGPVIIHHVLLFFRVHVAPLGDG